MLLPPSSTKPVSAVAAVVGLASLALLIAPVGADAAKQPRCHGHTPTMKLNDRGHRVGSSRRDVIAGDARANRLGSRGGGDRLCGGAGSDRISGHAGADRISGGPGADRLHGGKGADRISGGPGRDRIFGGPGRDRIDAADGLPDRIDCGPGRDVVYVDEIDRTRRCERLIPPVGASQGMAAFSLPPWSDAQWSDPSAYTTIQAGDIDGDGAEELVGRGPLGVEAYDFDPGTGQWLPLQATPSPALSDDDGWANPSYYGSIQLADIDGDGADELLARASDGLHAWRFQASSGSWAALPTLTELSDAQGWSDSRSYFSTVQAGNVVGDAAEEVLARAGNGMRVWSFSGGSWRRLASSGPFTDAGGWTAPEHFSTIHTDPGLIAAAGDHEVLWGRDDDGIHFYGFTSGSWVEYDRGLSLFANQTSTGNWSDPRAYSTIQAVENPYGDGATYIVGRSDKAFLGLTTYRGDGGQILDDTFSWRSGWDYLPYRSTIQAADLDGDGREEVIARASGGMIAFKAAGEPGQRAGRMQRVGQPAAAFADGAGWSNARYFSTIQAVDAGLEGSSLLVGRGTSGVSSFKWGEGGAWQGSSTAFPVFSGERATAYEAISAVLAGRGGNDLRAAYPEWSSEAFTNARITLAAMGVPAGVSAEAWADVKAAIDAELQNGGLVADWFDNYLRPNVTQTFQVQGLDATAELLRLDTKSTMELQAQQWALFTGIVNAAAKAGGAAAGPAGGAFSAVIGTVISTGIGAPNINQAMNTISARYIALRDQLQGNFQAAIKGVGVTREAINGDYGLQLAVADRLIRAGLWRKMNAAQTAATVAGAAKAYSIHTWQTLTPSLWEVAQFAANDHSNQLYCTILAACLYDTGGAAWTPATGTTKRGFGRIATRALRDQLFGVTSEACTQVWQFSSCNLGVNPADLFHGRKGWAALPAFVCDGMVSGRIWTETCTRRR